MSARTCTVRVSVVDGTMCGKPAIVTFGKFAECADHAPASALAPAPAAKPKRDRRCATCGHRHVRGACRREDCDCADH